MQFSNEPKACSHRGGCANEGTIFRDHTCGPLYDPRWFCEGHIAEADAESKRRFREGELTYQRSVVEHCERKLAEAQTKLAEMENQNESH